MESSSSWPPSGRCPLPEGQNFAALLFHRIGPRAFEVSLRAPTPNRAANVDVVVAAAIQNLKEEMAIIDRTAHQH